MNKHLRSFDYKYDKTKSKSGLVSYADKEGASMQIVDGFKAHLTTLYVFGIFGNFDGIYKFYAVVNLEFLNNRKYTIFCCHLYLFSFVLLHTHTRNLAQIVVVINFKFKFNLTFIHSNENVTWRVFRSTNPNMFLISLWYFVVIFIGKIVATVGIIMCDYSAV